jgi:hypothetical protein
MKSLAQPARNWSAGRFWPPIAARSGPPGWRATSSCTHSGLMSSSMPIRAPARASARARSTGLTDMLPA